VFDQPRDGRLVLDGHGNEISAAYLLRGRKPVELVREPGRIAFRLPKSAPPHMHR